MKEIDALEGSKIERVISLEGPGIQKSGYDVLYGKYHTSKLNDCIGTKLALELFTDTKLIKFIGSISTSLIRCVEAI